MVVAWLLGVCHFLFCRMFQWLELELRSHVGLVEPRWLSEMWPGDFRQHELRSHHFSAARSSTKNVKNTTMHGWVPEIQGIHNPWSPIHAVFWIFVCICCIYLICVSFKRFVFGSLSELWGITAIWTWMSFQRRILPCSQKNLVKERYTAQPHIDACRLCKCK